MYKHPVAKLEYPRNHALGISTDGHEISFPGPEIEHILGGLDS